MHGKRRGGYSLGYEAMRFEQRASPVFKLASDPAAALAATARRFKNGLNETGR
ncbi:Hypothetical protein bglu_1g12800 [Burkholderia glumae BGR1]|nr:Hypothetical protein bglu_1g12800 [Burkholderia glumae BGR1]